MRSAEAEREAVTPYYGIVRVTCADEDQRQRVGVAPPSRDAPGTAPPGWRPRPRESTLADVLAAEFPDV